MQRIGLSATQRPISEIARFLGGQDAHGGPRPVSVVDAGRVKELDLQVIVPVDDMREMAEPARGPDSGDGQDLLDVIGGGATRRSIWPAMYPALLELVRAHRSTLIFVNNRRSAERLALRLNELAEEDVARFFTCLAESLISCSVNPSSNALMNNGLSILSSLLRTNERTAA